MVEIVCAKLYGETVFLHHKIGIGEEEVGIGFEMHKSIVGKEVTIACKEVSGGKAFSDFLHLGIGESEPDFRHLSRGKEFVDKLDVGAQKAHVLQPSLFGFCGTTPHSRSLDIDTDKVLVGKETPKSYAVFTPAAA